MRQKNDFYIFVPSDLDLWPSDVKFASPSYSCPELWFH